MGMKGHQKAERKIKELAFQNDEDKKNQVAMSDLAGKLQAKKDLQEADRGGRGDRRPQPGQVQEGPAGAGGDRGPCQAVRVRPPALSSKHEHCPQDQDFEPPSASYLI